jgi:hypothetical protein
MGGSLGSATADILVRVKGDAAGLSSSMQEGDAAVGRFTAGNIAKVGGVLAGAFATGAVIEFGATAFAESERVSDAVGRLTGALQDDALVQALQDRADDFTEFGQSKQDMLELQGIFADIATSLGLTGPPLAAFTGEAAEAAALLATLNGGDPADWVDKIAKAATLGEDDLAALGVHLTEAEVQSRALADSGKASAEALTDAELAAAAYDLILEELNPKLDQARELTGDFTDRTGELQAKWETFTGEIGGFLEGPAEDFLDWALHAIDGAKLFGQALAEPENRLRGIFALLVSLADLNPLTPDIGFAVPNVSSSSKTGGGASKGSVTIEVVDSSPDATERAVIDAINTYDRQNGHL